MDSAESRLERSVSLLEWDVRRLLEGDYLSADDVGKSVLLSSSYKLSLDDFRYNSPSYAIELLEAATGQCLEVNHNPLTVADHVANATTVLGLLQEFLGEIPHVSAKGIVAGDADHVADFADLVHYVVSSLLDVEASFLEEPREGNAAAHTEAVPAAEENDDQEEDYSAPDEHSYDEWNRTTAEPYVAGEGKGVEAEYGHGPYAGPYPQSYDFDPTPEYESERSDANSPAEHEKEYYDDRGDYLHTRAPDAGADHETGIPDASAGDMDSRLALTSEDETGSRRPYQPPGPTKLVHQGSYWSMAASPPPSPPTRASPPPVSDDAENTLKGKLQDQLRQRLQELRAHQYATSSPARKHVHQRQGSLDRRDSYWSIAASPPPSPPRSNKPTPHPHPHPVLDTLALPGAPKANQPAGYWSSDVTPPPSPPERHGSALQKPSPAAMHTPAKTPILSVREECEEDLQTDSDSDLASKRDSLAEKSAEAGEDVNSSLASNVNLEQVRSIRDGLQKDLQYLNNYLQSMETDARPTNKDRLLTQGSKRSGRAKRLGKQKPLRPISRTRASKRGNIMRKPAKTRRRKVRASMRRPQKSVPVPRTPEAPSPPSSLFSGAEEHNRHAALQCQLGTSLTDDKRTTHIDPDKVFERKLLHLERQAALLAGQLNADEVTGIQLDQYLALSAHSKPFRKCQRNSHYDFKRFTKVVGGIEQHRRANDNRISHILSRIESTSYGAMMEMRDANLTHARRAHASRFRAGIEQRNATKELFRKHRQFMVGREEGVLAQIRHVPSAATGGHF